MLKPICPQCEGEVKDITRRGEEFSRYYCKKCKVEWTEDDMEYIDDEEYDDIPEEFQYLDLDYDIPEGCSACGGPYPHCKKSCNIFDD